MSDVITDTIQGRPAGAEGRGRHRGAASPEDSAVQALGRHRRTSATAEEQAA
ncbi:hypothetical protein [Streptomyces sp. NPDC093225]|uniref:hypothetical protein n=1 Tax=Streptomyces sp. NPDC093225 TaxID=3366034 RepID=UPI0037FEDBC7